MSEGDLLFLPPPARRQTPLGSASPKSFPINRTSVFQSNQQLVDPIRPGNLGINDSEERTVEDPFSRLTQEPEGNFGVQEEEVIVTKPERNNPDGLEHPELPATQRLKSQPQRPYSPSFG